MSARRAPTVSAVIPARNASAFVADSIRSVLSQTYAAVECVVVDDGSDDDTAKVAASFGGRVKLVPGPQLGPGAARNAGAAAATGSVLAFLDADDVWLPRKVDVQLAMLQRADGEGFVYTGHRVTNSALRRVRDVYAVDPQRSLQRALLLTGPGLASSSTAMVDRRLFEQTGGYDETLPVSEDLDWVWRLSRLRPMLAVPEPYALCRRHPQQHSRDLTKLEHCADTVIRRALRSGLMTPAPTAIASIAAYLGWRRLLSGDLAAAAAHLRLAVQNDWTRVAAVPARAVGRTLKGTIWTRSPAPDPASSLDSGALPTVA